MCYAENLADFKFVITLKQITTNFTIQYFMFEINQIAAENNFKTSLYQACEHSPHMLHNPSECVTVTFACKFISCICT